MAAQIGNWRPNRADTMWNKAVRRTLRIPYTTHRHLLPVLVQGCSFAEQHRARVAMFAQFFCSTSNDHVRLIGERARCSTTGVLERNWVKCTAHVPSNTTVTQVAVHILDLDARDNVRHIPGFCYSDIVLKIEQLCCK